MSKVNIVFYCPEIPQNTGNIMRTCVATNTSLHLIEPLGFKLTDAKIKRSGANHIQYCDYKVYPSWEDFFSKNEGVYYFLTRYGHKGMQDIVVNKDDGKNYYFVIGKESTGIAKHILKDHLDECIRLPMTNLVRSLNVSNVAAIMIYEALRQIGFDGLSEEEPENFKGKDFLENYEGDE